MELNIGHHVTVSIVVLNESLAPDVPDLGSFILRASCNACTIGVELDRVDAILVVHKRVDRLSGREVKQFDRSVIGS